MSHLPYIVIDYVASRHWSESDSKKKYKEPYASKNQQLPPLHADIEYSYVQILHLTMSIVTNQYVWQSRIEIEYYSVAYFEHIT